MTPSLLPLLPLLLAAADDPAAAVEVRAFLEAEELVVGEELAFFLDLDLGAGSDASEAGLPAPILQLDVPPSVRLVGRALTTQREQAGNDYLAEPYERLLDELPAAIPFELVAEPGPDETIGIIVIAYVARGEDRPPFFLRRRLELPLLPLAEAREGDPTDSSWGTDEALVQIGAQAPVFELPWADGTTGSNGAYLGQQNVLLMMYRAHW